jgi:hypothetical protein
MFISVLFLAFARFSKVEQARLSTPNLSIVDKRTALKKDLTFGVTDDPIFWSVKMISNHAWHLIFAPR